MRKILAVFSILFLAGSVFAHTGHRAELNVTDTIIGDHTGNRIQNLQVANNTAEFTGYFEVPAPCYGVQKNITEQGNRIIFNVEQTLPAPGEGCSQVLAMKKYNASFGSDEPTTVIVKHGGDTVKKFYTGEDEPIDVPSLIGGFFEWIFDLFI